ncbi:iron-siderophore ABC transporter substrate-binding protein [Serinibacter arcticus]|uniref:Iron compound ABC uptake transporter substrate-binding protein PiaA n=1 Tax=Serinibacter arcticus TaxID=1655435 RepID=A0A4Z1E5B7_9MICO|nr:iron-siderophore ABC transporter substrate-binding protein [Serinibacter arcticus]TGO04791.1 Iron compound ABC uptake transporter substrate-binding protein PiaA [Serinibacter arcticus]
MRLSRPFAATAAVALGLTLAACSTGSDENADAASSDPSDSASSDSSESGSGDQFPLTIEHMFGETVIESKPETVVTVDWANQEAALALGVVPAGMPKVTWGDDDDNGILPWVEDSLAELGAETPVLFDETSGYDFAAIEQLNPDVILAAYSGMEQEDYDLLSQIAPVVAPPEMAWGTTWQELTLVNGTALGLQAEAEALVTDLEGQLAAVTTEHPEIDGLTTIFSSPDPTDLSTIGFYTLNDPRALFLDELGFTAAPVVDESSQGSDEFWLTYSSEEVDRFSDVDVIVGYGGDSTVADLQADALWSRIPAVANGAVAVLPADAPLAAAANPSPLSIPSDFTAQFIDMLSEAARAAA